MASKSSRSRGRGSAASSKPSYEKVINDTLTAAKKPIWKASDAKLIADNLYTISRAPTEIDLARRDMVVKRVTNVVIEVLPHLAREIILCRIDGIPPETLRAAVDNCSFIFSAIGYDTQRRNVDFNSPEFQREITAASGNIMDFAYEILTSCDYLALHADLRKSVIHLIQLIFSAEEPPTAIFERCPDASAVFCGIFDAIEYDCDEFINASYGACFIIEQGCATYFQNHCLPPDLEDLVAVLLSTAVRVGFLPRHENVDMGVTFLSALGDWANVHRMGRFSKTSPKIEHYAAIPLVVAWSTDKATFESLQEGCLSGLSLFCHMCVSANPRDVTMLADDAARVLKFIVANFEAEWESEMHGRSREFIPLMLQTRFSHNQDFADALDCQSVCDIINFRIPTNVSFDESDRELDRPYQWPLLGLSLNARLTARFLAPGIKSAQRLLDYAVLLSARNDPDDEQDSGSRRGRSNISLLHYVLLATVSFDGLSYDSLLNHSDTLLPDLVDPHDFPVSTDGSNGITRALDFIKLLFNRDEDCDARIREVLTHILMYIISDDMSRSDESTLSWPFEGFAVRARLIDTWLVIMSGHKASTDREVEQLSALTHSMKRWWLCLLGHAPLTAQRESLELTARVIYCLLLCGGATEEPPGDEGAGISNFALAERAIALTAPASNARSTVAEEFICLSLWAYCSLYLPDEIDVPETALTNYSMYCSTILTRPRQVDDGRMHEAAREVVRLTNAKLSSSQPSS